MGGFIWGLVLVAYIAVSFLLVFFILIQQSKGEGLAGAFGGGGGSQSLFGASTPDVLQKFTLILAISFILLAFVLSFKTKGEERLDSVITEETALPSVPPSRPEAPMEGAPVVVSDEEDLDLEPEAAEPTVGAATE